MVDLLHPGDVCRVEGRGKEGEEKSCGKEDLHADAEGILCPVALDPVHQKLQHDPACHGKGPHLASRKVQEDEVCRKEDGELPGVKPVMIEAEKQKDQHRRHAVEGVRMAKAKAESCLHAPTVVGGQKHGAEDARKGEDVQEKAPRRLHGKEELHELSHVHADHRGRKHRAAKELIPACHEVRDEGEREKEGKVSPLPKGKALRKERRKEAEEGELKEPPLIGIDEGTLVDDDDDKLCQKSKQEEGMNQPVKAAVCPLCQGIQGRIDVFCCAHDPALSPFRMRSSAK